MDKDRIVGQNTGMFLGLNDINLDVKAKEVQVIMGFIGFW